MPDIIKESENVQANHKVFQANAVLYEKSHNRGTPQYP